MATYSIKLIDQTASSSQITPSIESELTGFFSRVFAKTSDSATVAWGTGAAADTIVLHFVEDIANSYIRQTVKKNATINDFAGGHTTWHGKKMAFIHLTHHEVLLFLRKSPDS